MMPSSKSLGGATARRRSIGAGSRCSRTTSSSLSDIMPVHLTISEHTVLACITWLLLLLLLLFRSLLALLLPLMLLLLLLIS